VDVGLRNRLQQRKGRTPDDLFDVDVFARFQLPGGDDDLPSAELRLDSELRPVPGLKCDLDAIFDAEEAEMTRLNARATMERRGPVEVAGEFRYRHDESSLLGGRLTYFFSPEWRVKCYGRYQFEESRVEEEWMYVQRDFDCIAVKGGVGLLPGFTRADGTEQEEEWRFIIEFWVKAFPKYGLSSGHWD